jgi:hypothetical protein
MTASECHVIAPPNNISLIQWQCYIRAVIYRSIETKALFLFSHEYMLFHGEVHLTNIKYINIGKN